MYINAYSAICAQDSFYKNWEAPALVEGAFLSAQEPQYKEFLPRKQLRRMSRVVRMGLVTAIQALEQAGQPDLDAIVSGTAWGCVQDTEKFLEALIVNQEQYLTPTAFVQSTHNTVAGQIALWRSTNGYNMTYVQGKVSFELALIDALTLAEQQQANTVLVNGIDELTPNLKVLLERLHCANREQPIGEGAGCFILSKNQTANSLARLVGASTAYLPKGTTASSNTWERLLAQAQTAGDAVDVVLCGQSVREDVQTQFPNAECCTYAQLCGHYPTNAALAMGFGVEVLQGNAAIREQLGLERLSVQRLAVYNQTAGHRGLIVLENIAE